MKLSENDLSECQRYVDFSIRYLLKRFEKLGAARDELVVKVFGGADVLPITTPRLDKPSVGAMNCKAATEVLAEEGLVVKASDTGGVRGRRIHFHTGTGEVLLHRLSPWKD